MSDNIYINFNPKKVLVSEAGKTLSGLSFSIELIDKKGSSVTLHSSTDKISEQNFTFWCRIPNFVLLQALPNTDWEYMPVGEDTHYFLSKKEITVKSDSKIPVHLGEGAFTKIISENAWLAYLVNGDSDEKNANFSILRNTGLQLSFLPTTYGTILNDNSSQSVTIYLINNGSEAIQLRGEQNPPETIVELLYYIDSEAGGKITRPDALSGTDTGVTYSIEGAEQKTEQVILPDLNENATPIPKTYVFDADKSIDVGGFLCITMHGIQTDFNAKNAYLFITFKDVPGYNYYTLAVPLTISAVQEQRSGLKITKEVTSDMKLQGNNTLNSLTVNEPSTLNELIVNRASHFKEDSFFQNMTVNGETIVNKLYAQEEAYFQKGLLLQHGEQPTPIDTYIMNVFINKFLPVGSIILWSGKKEDIPTNWHVCDGESGTPNLTGRFVVGVGDYDYNEERFNYTLKEPGGSINVTLKAPHLPKHAHGVSGKTDKDGAHKHGWRGYRNVGRISGVEVKSREWISSDGIKYPDLSDGSHEHKIELTSETVGGDKSHENRPPYLPLYYIMRIK